jgi:hypothetical protein
MTRCNCAANSPAPMRRVVHVCEWLLPGVTLALMPKCPACLAGYILLGTGLGVSFTVASYLRTTVLVVSAATLLFLATRFAIGQARRFSGRS